MLLMKPNCECCDCDLPADSTNARICSYECTFCADCVDTVLQNVCPNCGGGFVPRPVRPVTARRDGTSRVHQPASTKRISPKYTKQQMMDFAALHKDVDPADR